jgi:hypothetical protein
LFVFILYTLCCQFSGLFLFCFSSSCILYVANSLDCFCFEEKQNKNNPENWQHRAYKTKTNKTKTIQRIGNIGYTRQRQTKQKPWVANSLDCFCFVCLRFVYPMLPILWIVFVLFVFVLYALCCQFSGLSLFCFSSSCMPYVANSLDCFCFLCLRLVYPGLPILWIVFGNIGYTR